MALKRPKNVQLYNIGPPTGGYAQPTQKFYAFSETKYMQLLCLEELMRELF